MSDKEQDDEGTRWGLLLATIAAIVGIVMAVNRMRDNGD